MRPPPPAETEESEPFCITLTSAQASSTHTCVRAAGGKSAVAHPTEISEVHFVELQSGEQPHARAIAGPANHRMNVRIRELCHGGRSRFRTYRLPFAVGAIDSPIGSYAGDGVRYLRVMPVIGRSHVVNKPKRVA